MIKENSTQKIFFNGFLLGCNTPPWYMSEIRQHKSFANWMIVCANNFTHYVASTDGHQACQEKLYDTTCLFMIKIKSLN